MTGIYLLSFIGALILATLFTPEVTRLVLRWNIRDKPSSRKVHQSEVPSAGGLAIYLAFMLMTGISALIFPSLRNIASAEQGAIYGYLRGICLGASMVCAIGLIDDKINLSPTTKLTGQIAAVIVVMLHGVMIRGVNVPWGGRYAEFGIAAAVVVSALWLIGFMNAMNLIDGLDGSAAGITAIACITFFIVSQVHTGGQQTGFVAGSGKFVSILALTLAGSSIGFLRYNYYPAKVFMGDTGSLFLGFVLGALTIIGTLKTAAALTLIVPILIVGLPITDVILAVSRRIYSGRSIMQADRGHIHHRLLSRGWKQRTIVGFYYIVSIALGVVAVIISVRYAQMRGGAP